MENEDYNHYLQELDYYFMRLNQLYKEQKIGYMNPVIQLPISYEIKFCEKQIEKVEEKINRFKRINNDNEFKFNN